MEHFSNVSYSRRQNSHKCCENCTQTLLGRLTAHPAACSSPEESVFLRTVASSQTPWAEQFAVDPSFGYGIFSSHLAFCWYFLVSWATFQFA
jgi:hypothetical protein